MEAATGVRQFVREAFEQRLGGRPMSAQVKSNSRDLVTEVDVKSQTSIIDVLKRDFPDIPVIAEEGGIDDPGSPRAQGPRMVWLVDPLDGTTNFTRGIELFTVAISLAVDDIPVVAVVYQPVLDHLYTARAGGGAFLNARRLEVSPTAALSDFTLSCNLSYRDDERLVIAENIRRLLTRTAGLRILFSVALELCMVGRGSFDAALVYRANPWDIAAGCLIVREAGGRVTNWAGDDWKIGDASCLASNAMAHDDVLATLYAGE